VWIAGKSKLRERALVDMDAAALVANARQWRERVAAIEIS
jgi:5-methylthioadenosine/S-adenosylhomocysteine deaminase